MWLTVSEWQLTNGHHDPAAVVMLFVAFSGSDGVAT
jgi:hypothetical protein